MAFPLPRRKLSFALVCDLVVFLVIVPVQIFAVNLMHAFPDSLFALFFILVMEIACLGFMVLAICAQAALVRCGVSFLTKRRSRRTH